MSSALAAPAEATLSARALATNSLLVNFCIGKSSRDWFAPRRLRWRRNEFKTK
jgi:hypothetical protein